MEPIKINIEVGLKESTLTALKEIFGAKMTATKLVETEAAPQPDPQPEPKRKTEERPVPQPETPAPVEDDDDDLPEAPAPKQATPSENDARQAVKAARDRGVSAKVIKEYMQRTFGIASSVECPADRRAELIRGLANLAA